MAKIINFKSSLLKIIIIPVSYIPVIANSNSLLNLPNQQEIASTCFLQGWILFILERICSIWVYSILNVV